MAAKDLKISQLPSTTKLKGSELIPIVQEGQNKKITTDLLKGISDAPNDGNEYSRKDGNWSNITTSFTKIRSDINTKSDKINVETFTGGAITKQILPNKYYEFGKCDSLNITLAPEIPNIYNEYMFEFIANLDTTTLNLPYDIKWIGGTSPEIKGNCAYQVSIVNNVAVMGGF